LVIAFGKLVNQVSLSFIKITNCRVGDNGTQKVEIKLEKNNRDCGTLGLLRFLDYGRKERDEII
jgi:hypothetical protein